MPVSCSTPLALRHRADAAARDIKKAHAKNQNGFDFFQTEARQSAESLIFNQTFFIKRVPAVGANTRPTQAAANLIKNQVWKNQVSAEALGFFQVGNQDIKFEQSGGSAIRPPHIRAVGRVRDRIRHRSAGLTCCVT